MAAPQGPHRQESQHSTMLMWWLVPVGLVVGFLAVGFVTIASLRSSGDGSGGTPVADAATPRKLPSYWTVKSGDTYTRISEKTGLSLDDLQAFNSTVDPSTIAPGQRIKLRMNIPKPRKRLGPRYWTVRRGQSYGSIAAATGTPIDRLMRLNPKLKPSVLAVGDRVRLRR